MSNTLDITMDQGSSLSYTFTLQGTSGSAFDLTGYDARLQVRKSYGDSAVQVNCTLANSKLVLTDASGGLLSLKLAPADTSSIRFPAKDDDTLTCVYDLELQSPAGTVYKPARGAFTLNREVTR
jgi:hypothetical protein